MSTRYEDEIRIRKRMPQELGKQYTQIERQEIAAEMRVEFDQHMKADPNRKTVPCHPEPLRSKVIEIMRQDIWVIEQLRLLAQDRAKKRRERRLLKAAEK